MMPSDWNERATAAGNRDVGPGQLLPVELESPQRYPNAAERTVTVIRDVAAIVVLTLVAIFLILSLRVLSAIGDGVDRLTPDPGPTATGCPFGDTDCGG